MFGRRYAVDKRDDKYKITRKKYVKTYRYWNDAGWFGDQKETPQCVGYSWAHWLDCEPISQYLNPSGLYEYAQWRDEWPGENYEGTSVRAGAKVMHDLGLIKEYRWGWSVTDLVYGVMNYGPCVVGTVWFESMMDTDRHGFLNVDHRSEIVGGHAYLVTGVNVKTKVCRIKNSWGRKWGQAGRAYMSLVDMSYLISHDGEVCLAIEAPATSPK